MASQDDSAPGTQVGYGDPRMLKLLLAHLEQ